MIFFANRSGFVAGTGSGRIPVASFFLGAIFAPIVRQESSDFVLARALPSIFERTAMLILRLEVDLQPFHRVL